MSAAKQSTSAWLGELSRKFRHLRCLAPLFCCVLLFVAGCGVIKVDVDVYKGPLQNHLDVQTQQVAYMAISAKPLLVRLRTNLERRQRLTEKGANDDLVSKKLAELKDDWINPEEFAFHSGRAALVNRVLAAYDSRLEAEDSDMAVKAVLTSPAVAAETSAPVESKFESFVRNARPTTKQSPQPIPNTPHQKELGTDELSEQVRSKIHNALKQGRERNWNFGLTTLVRAYSEAQQKFRRHTSDQDLRDLRCVSETGFVS